MANHIIPKTGAQIDEAIAWAYTWKDYDLSGVVFDTTPTQNSVHGITSGGVYSTIASVVSGLQYEMTQKINNKHVVLSQAEYDVLLDTQTVDANTFYYIKET